MIDVVETNNKHKKVLYVVKDETVEQTLATIQECNIWLETKIQKVAAKIIRLKGATKNKFEEDPEAYILKQFSDDEFEKCIYAFMPTKRNGFSIYAMEVVIGLDIRIISIIENEKIEKQRKDDEKYNNKESIHKNPYAKIISGGLPSLGKRK